MDEQYSNALLILERAKENVEYIFNKLETKSFEEKRSAVILDAIISNIQTSISELKHYSKNTQGGTLYKLSNGKWAFHTDYEKEIYFSCGYLIEIFNEKENEWNSGRIEHSNGEYYFYNYEGSNSELYKGMKVRIRVDNS